MIRKGRFALIAAAVALMLIVFGIVTASAQAPDVEIAEAALQLWPEYDDPGLLIIFSGTLTGTISSPQPLSLPVPAGLRNVQATFRDASNALINRQFEIRDGRLTYDTPSPNFHLEYYVDRQPSGDQRDIQYTFEAPYPIRSLIITVQQPARATDFTLAPAADVAEPRADNLTYHSLQRTNLAAGEKIELTVRYKKTDSGLSSPQLAVPQEGGDASNAPVSGAAGNDWLPWVLIGTGVIVLAGIAGYYFLAQRTPVQPNAAVKAKPTAPNLRPPAPMTRPAASGTGFCTQCGKPLRAEDRFCAQCGKPRRNS